MGVLGPSNEAMEDTTLLGRAADGDEVAFELLVRRHAETVWRLARSFLSDDFTAEEAVQDTFLKAYRGLRSFRGDASVKTWLLAICHRTCIDRLRTKKAKVVPLDVLRHHRAEATAPDERLAIDEMLEELSQDERRAFVLVHVLSYTRDEAAGICGVPPSTMRSRLVRARERLAQMMGTQRDREADQ